MVDKYGLLQNAIVQINNLVDARGVDKCSLVINIIRNLDQMEKLMRAEDENNASAVKELTDKLEAYEKGGETANAEDAET